MGSLGNGLTLDRFSVIGSFMDSLVTRLILDSLVDKLILDSCGVLGSLVDSDSG